MAKKNKNNKARKAAKPAKKQTVAQQKRAARASARKTANKVSTLAKQGVGKKTARKAAEFAHLGYKSKTALAAAKSGKGTAAQAHDERVESIKAKLMSSKDSKADELREMIEEDFPGARFRIDALAELIAQGRYEEYVDEYRNDFATYKKAYFRRAEEAQELGSPDADRLTERALMFSDLLSEYVKTRRQYKKRG